MISLVVLGWLRWIDRDDWSTTVERTRHMYDFPNNDALTPLCHNLLTGGAVVRQVIANVNCPTCLDLWERAQ